MILELTASNPERGFENCRQIERLSGVRSLSIAPRNGSVRLGISTPSRYRNVALGTEEAPIYEAELFSETVHEARGSAVCGPHEQWVKVVIGDELAAKLHDYCTYAPSSGSKSDVVSAALEAYLDDYEPLSAGDDDE